MGEDPERLEREIERTRAKLGEDLDALEEKINPKKVANRSVDRAKEKVAEVKDKVVGAAGVAKEKVAEAASGAKEKVSAGGGDASGPAVAGAGTGATALNGQSANGSGTVSGLAGTAKEKAAPLAATARDKVAPLAATAKEKAGTLAASAREKAAARAGTDPGAVDNRQVATVVAGDAWQTVRQQTRRNPVAAGAVAFLIGVMLGR